jgi:hypothetical protein
VKTLFVVLFCGLILEGQTAPKAAPKTAPKAAPTGTPEHKHAQAEVLNALTTYNKQLAEFATMCHNVVPDDTKCGPSVVEYHPKDVGQLLIDVQLQGLTAEYAVSALRLAAARNGKDTFDDLQRSMKGFGTRNMEVFSELLKRLQEADTCTAVYHSTINKKTGDLTVGETEKISACRELESCPPKRD